MKEPKKENETQKEGWKRKNMNPKHTVVLHRMSYIKKDKKEKGPIRGAVKTAMGRKHEKDAAIGPNKKTPMIMYIIIVVAIVVWAYVTSCLLGFGGPICYGPLKEYGGKFDTPSFSDRESECYDFEISQETIECLEKLDFDRKLALPSTSTTVTPREEESIEEIPPSERVGRF